MAILNSKLIKNFTNDYINHINEDIFKAISLFDKNNMHHELGEMYFSIEKVSKNIIDFVEKIISKYKAEKITRLGDMHGFKCTVLLESGNNKYIFKPVQCHFWVLINELFILFNESKIFDFYLLKIISSDTLGMVIEFIENEKIDDINKFSYHYGAVIFILTLLRGTDFHLDNIFVVSSTPVLIDFETLFYPHILEFKDFDVTATSLIKTKKISIQLWVIII